ncbi:hypothetical protein [Cryobacterium tagatosivorans]|uniref:Nucleotidyltransferase domain-containing protein n=1 Tax=Cryobacterium tagatosivorans TaxID=1259199 RepID=A0A4R8UC02_9MICO|nr:hypothetical protein [Cryobacterium tagatosivorans]TFB46550.1 hypothetical protein E3O23_17395 [Cryobacterium tagatosivorans]
MTDQAATETGDAATRARFDAFLAELRATAEADPEIVGLVAMGSTAERDRVDEWSDHDFALLTVPGAEDRFRDSLAWLPGADQIALSVREHHGGMKVIYDDGRVLEFGITDLPGLAGWHANAYDVLYDANGVTDAMARVAARPLPTGGPDDARDLALVLTQLFIGVGRARRGELLSAGNSIRSEAVAYLLPVLGRRVPATGPERLDSLDPRRRFEAAHPAVGARIDDLLTLRPEDCARALLDLAEELLAPGWAEFPHRGVAAVRARLGWDPFQSRETAVVRAKTPE